MFRQCSQSNQVQLLVPSATTEGHKHSLTEFEGSSEVFLSSDGSTNLGKWRPCLRTLIIVVLVNIWIVCSCILMSTNIKIQHMHQISVPKGLIKSYLIMEKPTYNKVHVMLEGALLPPYCKNVPMHWMHVWVQLLVLTEPPESRNNIQKSNILLLQNISEVWYVPLESESVIGLVPEVKYQKIFNLSSIKVDESSFHFLEIKFSTNLNVNFPVSMGYNLQPIDTTNGIIYAALVLIGLYLLIIFEIIDRTLAAILASTMSVAILTAFDARPTMAEIISWIDVETLLLLFSMMILVTILGETGIFDYMSVLAYKLTGGKIWPLINTLCIITAALSCVLDNVTIALLITPVTIKLCEVINLNPVPVLIFTIVFANIGGAITPIGDPPNVIIASNSQVVKSGVTFGVFTLHMGIGVILSLIVVYIQLRIIYRNINHFKYAEPQEVLGLRREIAAWKRAAASMSSYSKDEEIVKETLMKRSATLLGQLRATVNSTNALEEVYTTNLKDLEKKYPIRDKVLLVKSGFTLFLVVCVFFLHSIPEFSCLGLGWTAFLGALLLLILYNKDGSAGIFCRVEWSTLLFFASLFILMEALSRLGLIEWIGIQTQDIIMSVGQESRLTVALILMLWVSGLASAFVDNLPLTTMMIRIATNLADNRELGLPLQPLIWALSFGACFGGNGTLFASSSNIVCAGVADQHGYRFTFLEFMKVGLPVMMTSMTVITMYLILCHVILGW